MKADDGNAYCWGQNDWGELGDSSQVDRTIPTIIPGLNGIIGIDNGEAHTCALNSQGGVVCWGHGWAGQLGDGISGHSFTPVNVYGLSNGVIQISAGASYNCVVVDTGGVKCWGINDAGQLGNGTTDWSSTPVDVIGLSSGVASVASGRNHTCAVIVNGSLKCWGSNWVGQLGDGTTNSSLFPVDVIGITNAIAISVGIDHTCALTAIGAVKCWGANSEGELGDGTYTDRSIPVDVIGLTSGVSKITNGAYHSCALLSGGAARCWGYNVSGQLGDNTVYRSSVPVDVIGLQNGGQVIEAGYDHTCVLLTNGLITCWGSNGYGQLGLGDIPWKIIPTGVLFYSVMLPIIVREYQPSLISQWRVVNSPTIKDLYSLFMVSVNDGWAVGKDGTIIRWNGSEWSNLSSPTNNSLQAVTIISDSDGWVVGNSGNILRWNGSAWNLVSSPTTNDLYDVKMISSNNGWAVGTGGVMLRWNGTIWSQITSPTDLDLKALDFINSSDGWAVGGMWISTWFENIVLHWDGYNWTIDPGVGIQPDIMETVDFVSSTDGWVAGVLTIYIEE